jgi:cytochrome oxidase Cu insertion factor (SCO1/SenC/PrrC family)
MTKLPLLSRVALLLVGLVASAVVTGAADDFKRERGKNADVKNSWEGKPLPDFKMQDVLNTRAGAITPAQLKGKVVLLDFWAFW